MPVTEFARLVTLACHDLRTPLATVNGFAKTLVRGGQLDDQIMYSRISRQKTCSSTSSSGRPRRSLDVQFNTF